MKRIITVLTVTAIMLAMAATSAFATPASDHSQSDCNAGGGNGGEYSWDFSWDLFPLPQLVECDPGNSAK
jgi:hypothetical protein